MPDPSAIAATAAAATVSPRSVDDPSITHQSLIDHPSLYSRLHGPCVDRGCACVTRVFFRSDLGFDFLDDT
jgi:hypothetical protein